MGSYMNRRAGGNDMYLMKVTLVLPALQPQHNVSVGGRIYYPRLVETGEGHAKDVLRIAASHSHRPHCHEIYGDFCLLFIPSLILYE